MKPELNDGSRIAVIGGGPSGSMFAYFLLRLADRCGLEFHVDIYEPRDFTAIGPAGCNMCGGIISESLIQILATEGIRIPENVIQRGIDSYVMHTDDSTVLIRTPHDEQRIATVHRGGGPRDNDKRTWGGFDGFLLDLAKNEGANVIQARVSGIERTGEVMAVSTRRDSQDYDLVVGATGVNSSAWKLYEDFAGEDGRPKITRAYITEAKLGREKVEELFGASLHIFLLDIPKLEFAAIIPKGDYATIAVLGEDIDEELLEKFFASESVRGVFPGVEDLGQGACHCAPRMNIGAAPVSYGDRFVMIGDSGVSRLNKDGIGAAYRTAKAAALTASLHGISKADFEKHFAPTYDSIANDNKFGAFMFGFIHKARSFKPIIWGIVKTASREQRTRNGQLKMSMALWDLFTGSAPYKNVFFRFIRPRFLIRFGFECAKSVFSRPTTNQEQVK